jgi:hypothetical protein
MSVSLTEDAVRERRKTVTRRKGWAFLNPETGEWIEVKPGTVAPVPTDVPGPGWTTGSEREAWTNLRAALAAPAAPLDEPWWRPAENEELMTCRRCDEAIPNGTPATYVLVHAVKCATPAPLDAIEQEAGRLLVEAARIRAARLGPDDAHELRHLWAAINAGNSDPCGANGESCHLDVAAIRTWTAQVMGLAAIADIGDAAAPATSLDVPSDARSVLYTVPTEPEEAER